MEKIKFRFYNKKTKKFLYYDLYNLLQEKKDVFGCQIDQYIGIDDCNGKELYENDTVIVKCEKHFPPEGVKGVIKFLNGSFCIYEDKYNCWNFKDLCSQYEIIEIGSVYEKELKK